MIGSGAIKAGEAYVQLSVEEAKLIAGLGLADARLKKWAASAQQSLGGADATGFSGKWAQSIAKGAGAGVAAHMIGAGMSGLSHVLKGEWEKLESDIAGIPLLGGAAISLANGFDDLVLGIREGMKKMREMALVELKYSQNVLAAAQKEMAVKMQIAMIGADPYTKQVMQINERARQETEAEKKRAAEAGGMTPANLGVISRIEERRQKEVAAAQGERDSAEGQKSLDRIVAAQEKASQGSRALEDSLFNLSLKLAQARGDVDALAVEEAESKRKLAKDLAARTITAGQYKDRLSELSQIYGELALAAEGQKQDATNASAKAAADALKESLMTPEERGKARVDAIQAMTNLDSETRRRSIQKALEDAAGRAMPSPSSVIVSRGQFGGQGAWMLGALGMQNESAAVLKGVEKNTAEMVRLARDWGVASFL